MEDELGHVFSVSEITEALKACIEGTFGTVIVQGEISNLSTPGSGHIYFNLKDEANIIKVAMFRYGRQEALNLEDGQKVSVTGKLTAYGKTGYYQIVAKDIQVLGVGELLVQFEKLKKLLEKEGLFDVSHKRPIPLYPSKIGIVTSPTGAAIKDILKIIEHRYRNVDILICPVLVQGNEAAGQICKAIEDLNAIGGIDVIIVGRGGGSIEDLWAFNDETLARAIYNSAIPIISAVGHEVDYSIADFTADLRASTPSNAAELVVPDSSALDNVLINQKNRLSTSLDRLLIKNEDQLNGFLKMRAFTVPFEMFEDYSQRVDESEIDISRLIKEKTANFEDKLKHLEEKNILLNPVNILKKGYSIVYDDVSGRLIKDSKDAGKTIKIRLYKGELSADVKKKV